MKSNLTLRITHASMMNPTKLAVAVNGQTVKDLLQRLSVLTTMERALTGDVIAASMV